MSPNGSTTDRPASTRYTHAPIVDTHPSTAHTSTPIPHAHEPIVHLHTLTVHTRASTFRVPLGRPEKSVPSLSKLCRSSSTLRFSLSLLCISSSAPCLNSILFCSSSSFCCVSFKPLHAFCSNPGSRSSNLVSSHGLLILEERSSTELQVRDVEKGEIEEVGLKAARPVLYWGLSCSRSSSRFVSLSSSCKPLPSCIA